jgi:hypothetical protein
MQTPHGRRRDAALQGRFSFLSFVWRFRRSEKKIKIRFF